MRLAIGAGLLGSEHCHPRSFSPWAREVVTQVASNSLVVARGGVGMSPGFPGAQGQRRSREGFLRALPFRCNTLPSADRVPTRRCSAWTPVCALALQRQAAYWGAIAR